MSDTWRMHRALSDAVWEVRVIRGPSPTKSVVSILETFQAKCHMTQGADAVHHQPPITQGGVFTQNAVWWFSPLQIKRLTSTSMFLSPPSTLCLYLLQCCSCDAFLMKLKHVYLPWKSHFCFSGFKKKQYLDIQAFKVYKGNSEIFYCMNCIVCFRETNFPNVYV